MRLPRRHLIIFIVVFLIATPFPTHADTPGLVCVTDGCIAPCCWESMRV